MTKLLRVVKLLLLGLRGTAPSWLVWDSGSFNYLYSDQLYGVELTGEYGKIGSYQLY